MNSSQDKKHACIRFARVSYYCADITMKTGENTENSHVSFVLSVFLNKIEIMH